jgi:hypothetical protein
MKESIFTFCPHCHRLRWARFDQQARTYVCCECGREIKESTNTFQPEHFTKIEEHWTGVLK